MSNVSSEPEESASKGLPDKGPQVPWGPVSAVLFTLLTFVGAQLIAGFVLVFVARELSAADPAAWLNSITGQFCFVTLSDVLIIANLWGFLRPRHGTLRHLGYSRSPEVRDLFFTVAGYAVYFVLLIVASALAQDAFHVNVNQKQELGFDALFSPTERLLAFASLVLLPPFVEETIFRGFLFGGLRKKMKFIYATIITSLLFAAPHLLASTHGLLWIAGVDTFVMSLVLCYLREKTGALWASIGLHALKNSIAYFILIHSVAAL